jgi:hypothetical protein
MVCNTCNTYVDSGIVYDNPSIMGRNITGRSVPGYDERSYPVAMTYGTQAQNLPTGKSLYTFDLTNFVIGCVVGGIITMFLITPSGRKVGAAAGERTARTIKGRSRE